jgi:hypothetical protein
MIQIPKGLLFGIVLIVVETLFPGGVLWPDTLELKEGRLVNGRYMGGTQNSIRFEAQGVVTTYPVGDVLAVTFEGQPNTSATIPENAKSGESAASTVPSRTRTLVPTGTRLLVRLSDALDSGKHTTGHRLTARLESDWITQGRLIAPKNAAVYGRLVLSKQARRLAGKSELVLTLTDVLIDNRLVPIRTNDIRTVASKGSGADTAGKTASGAAVGALIDGSDGARTGAKVGLGAAVLTRGGRLTIPAGTLLEFALAEPIEL